MFSRRWAKPAWHTFAKVDGTVTMRMLNVKTIDFGSWNAPFR